MNRRSFVGLAGVAAALWLPSVAQACKKLYAGEVAAASSSIFPPLPPDARESQCGSAGQTIIKVIGVGGLGGKSIEQMIERGVHGVDFVVADTDARALKRSSAQTLIQLGEKGHGTHAQAEAGFCAAVENEQRIAACLQGAHMAILVAGMGGGAGMGAMPVFAKQAGELGILTIGLVSVPFFFEGKRLAATSLGIAKLQAHSDSLILVPNDKLIGVLGDDVSAEEAFSAVSGIFLEAVSALSEIITTPGMIGVDFEDVRNVMERAGLGMIGVATASGANRSRVAAQKAIASPLLEGVDLAGAQGLLVTISARRGLHMNEISEVMSVIREVVADDAHVIFGTSRDDRMGDGLRVTIVATGCVGRSA